MPFDFKVLQDYLEEHKTQYVGKYKFHSGYQTEENVFKNHYYMLDQNFRQIDIFVEIKIKDRITYTFSEELHELEQVYIVKDAIKRILSKSQYKSTLHYSLYENYVKTSSNEYFSLLEPIDFCKVLNYMKYHQGINQETMDNYYKIFIPGLKTLIHNKNYKKFMDAINLLLKSVLYSYEWDGTNSKYLDTEYQYHLYYIREIIRLVYEHLDQFYKYAQDELFEAIHTLCLNTRFSFAIMTDFGSMVLSQMRVTLSMINVLKDQLVLTDKDEEKENENLVFSYIYYIFHNDYDQYYAVVLKILRKVIDNMLTFANHDLDLALGNSLLKSE